MTEPKDATQKQQDPGHDSSYKLLYSHVAMVRDLLQGFVPGDWLAQLDLGTLELASSTHTSDDLRDRTDDIIWRVRWGRQWLYIYVILEFQSTIDHWMVVRILTYIGLMYQDLIRTEKVKVESPPKSPRTARPRAECW